VSAATALFSLGSNVGDRRAHLQSAVLALPAAGVAPLRCSSLYDTDPVGEILDQPPFLNACLLGRTELGPLQLLDAVKSVERDLGRAAHGPRHGPRVIDIDILLLGDVEIDVERMRIPHAQLLVRRFVLVPALELDMGLRTPSGQSLANALAALDMTEGVRWAGAPLALSAPAN
jgi:2-amino-4-hydroxy-6-hydroxymethyldihydropteridine diphosphokinase